ncbi:hypothetical protein [Chelativorans sp.]|uniref:hypothetical protein n=1 Tax=Chelativorans sp. TaxID=2203393 RepID=UPI002811CBD5|nr:hypothetical protein [Chelativorans sp.]
MNPSANYSHSVTALLHVPARIAFAFMSDPIALGRWSLGCMDTRPTGSGDIFSGRSLFDGSEGFFRISADPERLIVDYLLGPPERMVPRISARIVAAETCDLEPSQCYVTLTAWRGSKMDDARWHRLCATHEAEILLIKAQCEAAAMTLGSDAGA